METQVKFVFVKAKVDSFQKELDKQAKAGFIPHGNHYVHIEDEDENGLGGNAYVTQMFVNTNAPKEVKENE